VEPAGNSRYLWGNGKKGGAGDYRILGGGPVKWPIRLDAILKRNWQPELKMGKKHKRPIYKPFRTNLRALWREFRRCSEHYPALYHDRLIAWSAEGQVVLSTLHWEMFTAANPEPSEDDDEWWMWERMSTQPGMGRYWGRPEGLQEFEQLAESAAILFREMEIEIDRPSCEGWLSLLHDVAFRQQLPLLRSDLRLWGIEGRPNQDEFDRLVDNWHCSSKGIRQYPLHPCRWVLAHSVFTSSMAAIEAALDPESVLVMSSALDAGYLNELFGPALPDAHPEPTVSDEEVEPPGDDDQACSHDHGTGPSQPEPPQDVSSDPNVNVFKRLSGTTWFLRFEGVGDYFPNLAGFYFIRKLLQSDGRPIESLDLWNEWPDHAPIVRQGTSDEPPDEQTSNSGRRMGDHHADMLTRADLELLREERRKRIRGIEHAKQSGDEESVTELEHDLEKLDDYLSKNTTIFGRPRRFVSGSPEEKIRGCVRKSFSDALSAIRKRHPRLADFLKANLVSLGDSTRLYLRAGSVTWET
jgi:hypothetical protein